MVVGCLFALPLKASTELQPHRAYYSVSLEGRPNPQSSIADVRGTMLIEFEKVPDGWTTQERSDISFYHDDGTLEHSRWGYVTYESEDASHLQFHTYRKVDDELVDNVQGQATRQKDGNTVVVHYQKPQKSVLSLSQEIFFPIHHLTTLLDAAHQGEKVFSRLVFDGSTEAGPSEVNTFIGAKKSVVEDPLHREATHQLANQPFWPVRFAVYGQGKGDYEPLYTTTQELLPNGIIKQYVIDYGNFKVRGVLERIELL